MEIKYMNYMRCTCPILIGFLLLQFATAATLPHDILSHLSSGSYGEQLQQEARMLQVGEELEYSVHYSFFNIGKVRFMVTGKEERNGRSVYHACAIMDSNPSLSWLVDLHIRFYTVIDQDAYTYDWLSEDSSSKATTYRKMHFDYETHKMFYEWGEKNRAGEFIKTGDRIIPISGYCQDGLSLFFYARQHTLEKRQSKIPTYVDTNEVTTNINFGIEHTSEEIDAVKYPIDVIRLDGRANFVGVFGLTGGFEGVFSNDVAGIPITARLKVILGSVKVELMSWKRDNWIPPKEIEDK
jgi:hypothetical protein